MFAEYLFALFLILAAVFGGLGLKDYLEGGKTVSPAVKARVRIAIIFAVVGVFLFFRK